MHVVIRSYSGQGAAELFDLAGQRAEDLKTLISGISSTTVDSPAITEGSTFLQF